MQVSGYIQFFYQNCTMTSTINIDLGRILFPMLSIPILGHILWNKCTCNLTLNFDLDSSVCMWLRTVDHVIYIIQK